MFYFRVIAEDEITISQYFLIALTCYISCSESLQTKKLGLLLWKRRHFVLLFLNPFSKEDWFKAIKVDGRPGIWPLSIMLHHSEAAQKFWI